jgi:hypothetical protein
MNGQLFLDVFVNLSAILALLVTILAIIEFKEGDDTAGIMILGAIPFWLIYISYIVARLFG